MAPAAWSYYGPTVLDDINSVGGDVAEDFYRWLYEVLQRPRNGPRVMLTKNRPTEYTVPFDAALLTCSSCRYADGPLRRVPARRG